LFKSGYWLTVEAPALHYSYKAFGCYVLTTLHSPIKPNLSVSDTCPSVARVYVFASLSGQQMRHIPQTFLT